jgi:hypothetical protein
MFFLLFCFLMEGSGSVQVQIITDPELGLLLYQFPEHVIYFVSKENRHCLELSIVVPFAPKHSNLSPTI